MVSLTARGGCTAFSLTAGNIAEITGRLPTGRELPISTDASAIRATMRRSCGSDLALHRGR